MTEEAAKFEKYRDEWWNPAGKLFSLHRINPLRFEYFSARSGELAAKRVLDVGCGGGLLSEKFAEKGAFVTGIDLSPVAIEAAREHAEKGGLTIDYRVIPIARLRQDAPPPFDIIVCAEVLEHVDDIRPFLSDALSLLKPEGIFFFGTINKTLRARLLAITVAEDILRMVPRGTHAYERFIRPSQLARVLEENNTKIIELKGMSYDPLVLEFKITNDTSVNYLGYARKQA